MNYLYQKKKIENSLNENKHLKLNYDNLELTNEKIKNELLEKNKEINKLSENINKIKNEKEKELIEKIEEKIIK